MLAAIATAVPHALIVENFNDIPYFKEQVEPHIVAAITLTVDRIMNEVDLPVGINLLRNDARSALAVAAMTGAAFIRVNVHTGAMVTDQGIIEGQAAQTLRYRQQLGANVEIWADVHVKHGAPIGSMLIEDAAEDALHRGLADALIVTGTGTGRAADPSDLERVRRRLPAARVMIGSGVNPENVGELLPAASGFIVGTWVKQDGDVRQPVDPRSACRGAGKAHSRSRTIARLRVQVLTRLVGRSPCGNRGLRAKPASDRSSCRSSTQRRDRPDRVTEAVEAPHRR